MSDGATITLTGPQLDRLLSILNMAQIEYAELIETVCTQAGRPVPEVTAAWLVERQKWR